MQKPSAMSPLRASMAAALDRRTAVAAGQAATLTPGDTGSRIFIDRPGSYHVRTGTRSFEERIRLHANSRNEAVAEFLLRLERARSYDAVDARMVVGMHGAVVQAFAGTRQSNAAHVLPCQLVVGNRFPFQLAPKNGKPFSGVYLTRTVELFGRCSWVEKSVNSVDRLLDWSQDAGCAELFRSAAQNVVRGAAARDTYDQYRSRRYWLETRFLERLADRRLSAAVAAAPDAEPRDADADRARAKAPALTVGETMKVVEVYRECDALSPATLLTGELKQKVDAERWVGESGSSEDGP